MAEKNKTPRSVRRAFGGPKSPPKSPEHKTRSPMSSIEKVKEMNKNLPKDAGGKYTLKRSIRNPNGRIEFKPNRSPKPSFRPEFKPSKAFKPGFRYGGKVKKMKGKK